MMNTKKYVFLFKIVLFLVNYQECYFVFIEFEYYVKLFVWMMKTMVSPPDFMGDLEQIKYWILGGGLQFPIFPGDNFLLHISYNCTVSKYRSPNRSFRTI